MTFINSTTNLIRRSTKDIFYIFNNHGLYYNYYNKDNKLSKRNILISNNTLDYTQFYFSIDKFDKIYGIIKYSQNGILSSRGVFKIWIPGISGWIKCSSVKNHGIYMNTYRP